LARVGLAGRLPLPRLRNWEYEVRGKGKKHLRKKRRGRQGGWTELLGKNHSLHGGYRKMYRTWRKKSRGTKGGQGAHICVGAKKKHRRVKLLQEMKWGKNEGGSPRAH